MRFPAAVAAGLLATVTASAAHAVSSGSTDKMINQFSYTSNPSGHWLYARGLAAFTNGYSGKYDSSCFLSAVQCWEDADPDNYASAVALNRGTTALSFGSVTLPPHYVVVATAGSAGVVWFAPDTELYDLVVTFLGIDGAEPGHQVGVALFGSGQPTNTLAIYTIASAGQRAILRKTVGLNAGDSISIANTNIGSGTSLTYVAMRAHVTPHGGCRAGAC